METEKLYYADPYLREFTAAVRACVPGRDGYAVTLDRSAFYPEGGGQPGDTGTLNGIPVSDTHIRDGEILHFCAAPLAPGTAVTGCIDWARRFDRMQQHSGEHIVSGMLCARFHCDNVGFHMGAETVVIDYNADIPWAALSEVEAAANRYIWEDHPIRIELLEGAALDAVAYRSKKALEGKVRIVSFPGADCCACCGTHVSSSGQVGVIKFLSCQKFRDGVRIELLCGGRAYRHLAAVWTENAETARALSVKPEQTHGAVAKLQAQLLESAARAARLEEESFAALAAAHAGETDVLLLRPAMAPDSVRRLADAVARHCGGLTAVFAGDGGAAETRFNYALVRGDGADIAPLVRTMNAALCGRGGGRKGFAQGSAETGREAIEAFFRELPRDDQ